MSQSASVLTKVKIKISLLPDFKTERQSNLAVSRESKCFKSMFLKQDDPNIIF